MGENLTRTFGEAKLIHYLGDTVVLKIKNGKKKNR